MKRLLSKQLKFRNSITCLFAFGSIATAQQVEQSVVDNKITVEKVEMADPVKALVARMHKAIGSDNLDRVKTFEKKIKILMPAHKLELRAIRKSKGNKILQEITMPQGVTMLQGFDGAIGWAKDPVTGNRLLGKGEINYLKLEDTLGGVFQKINSFDKVELKEERKFNGKACHVLLLSKKDMNDLTLYVDKKTDLQEGYTTLVEMPQGKINCKVIYSSYSEHKNGFKYVTEKKANGAGTDIVEKVTEVSINTPIGDEVFQRPE